MHELLAFTPGQGSEFRCSWGGCFGRGNGVQWESGHQAYQTWPGDGENLQRISLEHFRRPKRKRHKPEPVHLLVDPNVQKEELQPLKGREWKYLLASCWIKQPCICQNGNLRYQVVQTACGQVNEFELASLHHSFQDILILLGIGEWGLERFYLRKLAILSTLRASKLQQPRLNPTLGDWIESAEGEVCPERDSESS